ncbi:hypothetical protein [Yoonia litorea]|uniref:Uncharacterized protein n=1 Tax=Yoonia litorea TaxID=1123755 RepID=A0A1I6LL57_9RHOB|nr:hypothetical protein [Yoonia litorea]SFS04196.1 hypothetical protein SAMN05444714_0645 [Yoonia litorea]
MSFTKSAVLTVSLTFAAATVASAYSTEPQPGRHFVEVITPKSVLPVSGSDACEMAIAEDLVALVGPEMIIQERAQGPRLEPVACLSEE